MVGCSWFEHRYRVAVTCDGSIFNRIQDGPFQGCSQMLDTYPTMMKLGTGILSPRVLLAPAFFHQKSVIFVLSRNTDKDCI